MFRIENKKNLHFVRQYIRQDMKIDTVKYRSSALLDEFISAVNEANLASADVLNELNEQYLVSICIASLLDGKAVSFSPDGNRTIKESVKNLFAELILEEGRRKVGYHLSNSGKITFNKKSFAEVVMEIYELVADRNDPEILLVYNKTKGYLEDAKQPLHRLIIEIAHASGDDIEDTWTSHLENSIIDILKRKVTLIQSANFNQSHFPLGNLTLNSTTADLVPHAPSYFTTYGSPINYNEDAECTEFIMFLGELFDDEATIKFVQEWFGYTLSCGHQANAFLIGIGAGANGKSTLFDVLAQLLGIENVSSAPLSNFNSEFGLEPLISKKLNLATESDVDAFKTGKLKALTAGEDISINRKNKIEITTKLPTKLVFLMNELPLLSDDSYGFERRLLILPFDKTFTESEQDKDLPKKLSNELEGILNWSLEGLRRLIANNYTFTISESMKKAKELYLGVGDPVAMFVEENVVASSSNVMEGKEVINAYKLWMKKNEHPFKGTESPRKFWGLFDEALSLQLIAFTRAKSGGKAIVRDIALK